MFICGGCGATLDTSWKYCIQCGLATTAPSIPPAIRPEKDELTDDADNALWQKVVFTVVGVGATVAAVALIAYLLLSALGTSA